MNFRIFRLLYFLLNSVTPSPILISTSTSVAIMDNTRNIDLSYSQNDYPEWVLQIESNKFNRFYFKGFLTVLDFLNYFLKFTALILFCSYLILQLIIRDDSKEICKIILWLLILVILYLSEFVSHDLLIYKINYF